MNLPYEGLIGWRYTLAGRAGRKNGFISGVSVLGIAPAARAEGPLARCAPASDCLPATSSG
jgi:hypothetical protein